MRVVSLAKASLAAALTVGAGLVVMVPSTSAEIPDVGQDLATAANAVGQTTITGSLEPSTDVDLYRICIANPAAFSVAVAGGGGDGQLWLFGSTGLGEASQDDAVGVEPAFPAGDAILSALAPGFHYLGLSNFDVDPSSAGGAIFPDGVAGTDPVQGPTGPGGGQPLASWAGGLGTPIVNYTMTLTGTGSCDPGQDLATAANAVGQTIITGSLEPSTDVDLYRICIANPAAFSVAVAGGGGDGQLWLFGSTGLGEASQDDAVGVEPAFPAGDAILSALAPGFHYLGLSNFDVDPSSAGGAIFPDGVAGTDPVQGPTGPGGGQPLASWAGGLGTPIVNYTMTLTGTGSCAPPVVTVPGNIVVFATGPSGAQVTFTPSATDFRGVSLTVVCTPPSGSTFPLGTTTVPCDATDLLGQTTGGTFTVSVLNNAPEVTVPADITVFATSASGATVTYTATATDIEDGTLTPDCSPPSGSNFFINTITVICTATDSSGASIQGFFNVTVLNNSPVLTVPADLTVPATSAAGASVTFSVSATDIEDETLAPTCTPSSGSTFAIGTTTVECTVTDSEFGTDTDVFTVTVENNSPVVTVPADLTIPATSATGATVTFSVSAIDVEDGTLVPSCTPASGSTFPIGTTTVNCTVTDSQQLTHTEAFTVTVVTTTTTGTTTTTAARSTSAVRQTTTSGRAGQSLADTGSQIGSMGQLALALIASGVVALAVQRARARDDNAG